MPGTRDQRSMGGGPHSAGGSLSAGGRLLPPQQVVPMPPPMGAQSVKLMNELGKIQEGAEQVILFKDRRSFYKPHGET